MSLDLKQLSKKNITANNGYTNENIIASALMRIADSSELMAQNYLAMQRDIDYLRRRNKELIESGEKMSRRISALRGVITKMKKARELNIKQSEG